MNKFAKSYHIFKNFDEFSESEEPFNQIVNSLSMHYSQVVSNDMTVQRLGDNEEVKIGTKDIHSNYISLQVYRLEHPPIQNGSHWIEFSVHIHSGNLDVLNNYCNGIEKSLKFLECI